ncbi:hypothetical protein [Cognatiyoonia sp. IB215182]|uniref:hypothetical protein n=1 Tax=Cognatiyoonia sp. IB215182 TaxID=3097353 RepID=UPI002A143BFF|nr:hypothetical protein [Cognatiyoonia sp. IB215182]MDX8352436.1 hypothetical protein [Cognatiyoonia sp. IB215182]
MTDKEQHQPPQKLESHKKPKEHLLNVIKAALSTAPFGGGIASLMTDYIPSMKERRLEEFVREIAADLKALQDRIDEDTIQTDEFAFVLERCFRGAAEHYQSEKLQAFRGILMNSAVGSEVEADEGEYYLNVVERLSALHLRILAFLSDPKSYLLSQQIPEERIRGGLSNFMPVAIPGVDLEAIRSAFGDLYQFGFLNTDKSMFNTMTTSQGLELLGDRLTEAGRRFVVFCKTPQ